MQNANRRQAYPSDLTDAQWELLEPLIPPLSPDAVTYTYERRELVNAILYVLRSGCPWRLVPHDLPLGNTAHYYFRRWQREGVWDRVLEALRMRMRSKDGRDAQPSAGVIDSQSIKTSAVRGPEKGYDAGKKIWGRKRHALVDTQGNLLAIKVTGADCSDQEGAHRLLKPLQELFPRMKLVWGDSHYGGQMITWVKVNLGWIMQPVRALTLPKRGLLVPEGTDVAWDTLFPPGFRPLPRRWVVERSFAWITRWRRLCRDHEGLPQSSEAFIALSASYRMLTQLAPAFPS